jgi:hypothetical protein
MQNFAVIHPYTHSRTRTTNTSTHTPGNDDENNLHGVEHRLRLEARLQIRPVEFFVKTGRKKKKKEKKKKKKKKRKKKKRKRKKQKKKKKYI